MRISDWNRLRKNVDLLSRKRKNLSAFAWALVGIATSSGFTIITWLPAYRVLTSSIKLEFAWVTPSFAALAIASLVLALIVFVLSRQVAQVEEGGAMQLGEDMDFIYNIELNRP